MLWRKILKILTPSSKTTTNKLLKKLGKWIVTYSEWTVAIVPRPKWNFLRKGVPQRYRIEMYMNAQIKVHN